VSHSSVATASLILAVGLDAPQERMADVAKRSGIKAVVRRGLVVLEPFANSSASEHTNRHSLNPLDYFRLRIPAGVRPS
jgi:hypothetical protein